MDRDPDRACLVGNRPGDRLANPPGGVGRKLESPPVFVLVDRTHQAGVALLDEIEERQAAIAVFLGNRHHQPEIGSGEISLGTLVFCLKPLQQVDARAQRARALERGEHEIPQLLTHVGTVVAGADAMVRKAQVLLQPRHAACHPAQQLHQRLHPTGAQAQFLDQRE